LGGSGNQETLFKICQHLSANPTRKIRRTDGKTPFDAQFSYTD
jgi:hypothetical protein